MNPRNLLQNNKLYIGQNFARELTAKEIEALDEFANQMAGGSSGIANEQQVPFIIEKKEKTYFFYLKIVVKQIFNG